MTSNLTASGFFLRWGFALVLVAGTYNPHGVSFFHWIQGDFATHAPLKLISGVLVVIGWVIYGRATLRSLGPLGLGLACALFAAVVWALVYYQIISLGANKVFQDMVLVCVSGILALGMSWSHIRRRLSGQVDTDDVES
jgi:protein-S-isoprenylcysteine O-methyltransferase Ste14